MRIRKVICVAQTLTLSLTAFSQRVDIIELHRNDDRGIPCAPYGIGSQVTVEGVVTVPTGIYSRTNFEIFLQDESAGINVFMYNAMPTQLKSGDYVRVTGLIDQYKGLTEITDPSEVIVLSAGHPVPEPLVLTCDDISRSFQSDFFEPNEARLIRVNNVRIVSSAPPSYTIQDQSGACTLFIDPDTDLTLPQSMFDVIGILKQYDGIAPYTTGYEICPRFSSDFTSHSGPIFLHQPTETIILAHEVTFLWNTDTPSTTLIKVGGTEELEMGAVGDSALVTVHQITVSGLEPATIYHGVAISTDQTGSSRSKPFVFCSASDESTGEIQVYFTRSVEAPSVGGEPANGGIDLSQILIEQIDRTRYSLDVCYYSLTHDSIANAFLRAKNRGVSVRFIYEAENESNLIQLLAGSGIPAINDEYGANSGDGVMHNKFVIGDYRDHSTGADDWLWTGSANATYSGSRSNAENALLIRDEALCAAYTAEFEEMWGSSSESPDANESRFGSRKTNNTPHRFSIGGIRIEQYMSPSDDTESAMLKAIRTADKSLFFCIFTFTSPGIAREMQTKLYTLPGFCLRGVFDTEQATGEIAFLSTYSEMAGIGSYAWSPAADVHLDANPDLLHHKYMIIDPDLSDSDPLVVSGSHNWSKSANTINDENTLIIHGQRIAQLYLQEFAARYHEAGGTADLVSSVLDENHHSHSQSQPTRFVLGQNYPNPFNASTTIKVRIDGQYALSRQKRFLKIHSIVGTCVRTIELANSPEQAVEWNGLNDLDQPVASGVYFCTIQDEREGKSIKMALIR